MPLANALAIFFNVVLQVVQITGRHSYFKSILKLLFQLLSFLPLALLHALGVLLGLVVFAASRIYRQRLLANTSQSGLAGVSGWQGRLAAACQAGMMVAELPRLWLGRPVRVVWNDLPAMQAVFERSKAEGKGIIVLSPHIGCWEVVGQSIADESFRRSHGENRMTVMYRPARQVWLDDIIRASRETPSMQTVPADLSGVRQTLRALKGGGIIGLLPDQVPLEGMGVWVKVFGMPAYTMTMAAKLAQTTKAITVLCWCERLSFGRGYRIFTQVLDLDLNANLDDVVQQINDGVEVAIRALPTQYLWGYARYKKPKKESKQVSK